MEQSTVSRVGTHTSLGSWTWRAGWGQGSLKRTEGRARKSARPAVPAGGGGGVGRPRPGAGSNHPRSPHPRALAAENAEPPLRVRRTGLGAQTARWAGWGPRISKEDPGVWGACLEEQCGREGGGEGG